MRILVSDNSDPVRNRLIALLQEQGFAVDAAETCVATVRSLARQNYDCLILDDDLSDGKGMDIFRVLLSPAPHVLLFTGQTLSASARKSALRLGVEKIFAKPDEIQELVDFIAGCNQAVPDLAE